MKDELEENLRRMIAESEADIGFDRDAVFSGRPADMMDTWMRMWWRMVRGSLPGPRG
ncbi:hypothetical protein [Litorisediminicola beolgyonensis]|uniref:Uncharacterized protein n=1 Tax=Litorisediminicola beolgyonensis TaxID=1173614 RepID=A0ABW3ZJ83_9RHOB